MKSWKGYVIRSTYGPGKFEGKSYILVKEGYVRDEDSFFLKDECYSSEVSTKRVITRYINQQDLDRRCNRDISELTKTFEVVEVVNGKISH